MSFLHFDYMSEKLGYQTNFYVVLPDSVKEGKVPKGILYLLHGGSGNGLDWFRYTSVERYSWPYELAVVSADTDGTAFYADMEHGYPYFTYLTEELPRVVESLMPILKKVEKRYVAGLSMGGYGAFKWAFNKPDYFDAAANLSGASFIVDLFTQDKNRLEKSAAMFENNWGGLEKLAGSISDSKTWLDKASEYKKLPKLFAGIGTEDYSYSYAQKYLEYAKEKGIDIHYEEMPGQHEWAVWDEMIQRFLKFATE